MTSPDQGSQEGFQGAGDVQVYFGRGVVHMATTQPKPKLGPSLARSVTLGNIFHVYCVLLRHFTLELSKQHKNFPKHIILVSSAC